MYVNIHKSELHRATCRYPTFKCVDVISWIMSHTDPKTVCLGSTNGRRLSSFLAVDYHLMYHFPKTKLFMDSYFYAKTNYLSTKEIVKGWVKEPPKLC